MITPDSRARAGLGREVGYEEAPGQTEHHRHQDLQGGVQQQHDQPSVPAREGDAEDDGEAGDGQHVVHAGRGDHETRNALMMMRYLLSFLIS